jgi:hypothetical protein
MFQVAGAMAAEAAPDTVGAPAAGGMEDTGKTTDLARKSGKRMYEAPDLKQIKMETSGDTRRCTRITGVKEFQAKSNIVFHTQAIAPQHYLRMRTEAKTVNGSMQWSADRVNGDHKDIIQNVLATLSNQEALRDAAIIGPIPPSLHHASRDDLAHNLMRTCICTVKASAWYLDGPRHVPPDVFAGLVDTNDERAVECMEYLHTLIGGLKVVEAIAIDDTHGHQHDAREILLQAAWPYSQPIRKILMDIDVNNETRLRPLLEFLRNVFSGYAGTVYMLENGFNVFEDAAKVTKNKHINPQRPSPTLALLA